MRGPATLPRRDLWLLPLISVLTVILMLGAAEVTSRVVWPEQDENACEILHTGSGPTFKPNCTSTMKTAEGPWYTNQYNECGFRTPQPCGPTPDGAVRIALLGSSVAEGLHVPYADTLGARLSGDLTRDCGRPVEVQNLGAAGYLGDLLVGRMREALAVKPDAVLLIVTAWDIESLLGGGDGNGRGGGTLRQLFLMFHNSRAIVITEHFLFRNRSIYEPIYLRYGDKADYLRPPFTSAWQERLRHFDELIGKLSIQASTAGAPLMIAFIPPQAPMVLMTSATTHPGIDPFALGNAIKATAERHGASFVDTSQILRQREKPELLYYQVDGHLSGEGLPIAAGFIADKLMSGSLASFAGCRSDHPTSTALAK
jgi:hypothetical protein